MKKKTAEKLHQAQKNNNIRSTRNLSVIDFYSVVANAIRVVE